MKYDDLVKRLKSECILPYTTIQLMRESANAIEELSQVADVIPHVCECCIGCEVESGSCNDAFILSPKRAKEYLSNTKWIPVTELLPDENDVVLITDSLNVGTGYLIHGYGWISPFNDIETSHVSHWMPFPQTPKEK